MDDKFNTLTAIAVINVMLTAFLVLALPLCLVILTRNPIWIVIYALYALLAAAVLNWSKSMEKGE